MFLLYGNAVTKATAFFTTYHYKVLKLTVAGTSESRAFSLVVRPTDMRLEFGHPCCVCNNEVKYIEGPTKAKLNSVALVRERTIPTERPPPVGEVSANFCG